MYIATLTYQVNDETKTFSYNVDECYMHVAQHGHNCNFVLPTADMKGEFEQIIGNQYEIKSLILADADANELYASTYWNRASSINLNFPTSGEPRCDLQLYHYEPNAAQVVEG